MEALELNMHVRTEHGIYKINGYINNNYTQKFTYIDNKGVSNILENDEIIKASHNIIDLIEVGDYLNGFKVSKIERYDTKTIIKIGNSTFNVLEGEEIYTPSYDNNNGYEKLEKLKSIVTKEQFENISYEVK